MKAIKIILSIMGTFFFFCMVAIPMMYSCGTIKNIRLSALSITLFALLTLICILGRKILTRHEDNPEWEDEIMNERILNLLSLCLQAKEKGIDAFLDYSPHVNGYDLRVFNHGWVENGNPDFKSHVYECHDDEESQAIYEQSVSYLKGLIDA